MWLLRKLKTYILQPSEQNTVSRRFQVELDLIRGKSSNQNNHRSILHFSVNKAATMYVQSILARCAAEEGMLPVHIHGYAFHSDFPYLDHLSAEEMVRYQHIFRPRGYLYSVFGGMIEGIPDMEEYLIMLMIRDPRDVLVSKYYSIAYSHSEPDVRGDKHRAFMKQRVFAREAAIDEYVIAESERIQSVYQRYLDSLVKRYSAYFLTRYEDMIADFPSWLQSVLDYCQFAPSEQLLNALNREHSETLVRNEDKTKYLRKGIAGDHKTKLGQHTIRALNFRLGSILETFGYEL